MHILDTVVANYLIFLCALIAVCAWLTLPMNAKKRFLVEALAGGLLALLLAKIGSALYYDPRPFVIDHFIPYIAHTSDNGFPSDHVLLSSFIGFLILRYNKKVGIVLLMLAGLIGEARVVAGVHHFVDVVASFIFAGTSMAIVYAVSIWLQKKHAAAHAEVR